MQFAKHSFLLLMTLSFVALISACQEFKEEDYSNDNSFKLIYPPEGARLDDSDGYFKMEFNASYDAESLVVAINGQPFPVATTDFLEVSGNILYGPMDNLRGAFALGDNVIGITAENDAVKSKSFEFYFDNHLPRLSVTAIYPEGGSSTDKPVDGQPYVVEGSFIDPSAIIALTFDPTAKSKLFYTTDVNGQSTTATIENASTFRVVLNDYRGTKTISYTLVDDMDQTNTQVLLFEGSQLSPMIGTKVNNSFFESLEPVANEMLLGMLDWFTKISFGPHLMYQYDGTTEFKSLAAAPGQDIKLHLTSTSGATNFDPLLGEFADVITSGGMCASAFEAAGKDIQDCALRLGKISLEAPVTDFGVFPGDSNNELKGHMDIRFSTLWVDVEVFGYERYGLTDQAKYLGGYKARIGLKGVTLRAFVKAYKNGNEFVGLGEPGDFDLRYTDNFTQALANFFQNGNVVPLTQNTSCNICKFNFDNALEFLNKYGFIAREVDFFSGGSGKLLGSEYDYPGVQGALNDILKPAIGRILEAAEIVDNVVSFVETGEAVNRLDEEGNEPSDLTQAHVKQVITASSIDTWAANPVRTKFSAELLFSGSYAADGASAKSPTLGVKYHDDARYTSLNKMTWTNSTNDKELDFVWAVSGNAINEFLQSRHQAGFLAMEPWSFKYSAEATDGDPLSLNNLYSRLLLGLQGVNEMDDVEVQLVTNQAPQIELLGLQPEKSRFEWNLFGFQMPSLGGNPAVAPSVKLILSDVQIIVTVNGMDTPLLDINMDVELDAFIGAGTNGLPGLTPKDTFSSVRVNSINQRSFSSDFSGFEDMAIKSLLTYGLQSKIDEVLLRTIDEDKRKYGVTDQLNTFLNEWMVDMSVIEDIYDAGNGQPIFLDKDGNELAPLTFQDLFNTMDNSILYTPVFHWFGVDKSSGWLTMGVDIRVSRPDICPQFAGLEITPGSGNYGAPVTANAAPLSFCIHNTPNQGRN